MASFSPFCGVALGLIAGFAIIVPFGGLPNVKESGTTIQCDLMGCSVAKKKELANGPSVGSHVPSQRS